MTNSAVVFYVRHAENVANITGQFSHRAIDLDLTERGISQSRQVAKFLVGETVGVGPIFASPLRRAIRTAEFIGDRLRRPVTVIEAFREVDVGDLEGLSGPDALDAYWDVLTSWRAGDRGRRFPGGESHFDMVERMQAGFAEIMGSRRSGPFVLCAHAGLLRAGFTTLLAEPFDMRLPIPNCSVSRLEIASGRYAFSYLARSDFLSENTPESKPQTSSPTEFRGCMVGTIVQQSN